MVACPIPPCDALRLARIAAGADVAMCVEHHGDAAASPVVLTDRCGETRVACSDTARGVAVEGYHCLAAHGRRSREIGDAYGRLIATILDQLERIDAPCGRGFSPDRGANRG